MTQYNSLNVKLSNSQLNKLKSAIKNETDVVLRLSSNMIGKSDDETSFPHKLFLTNRQGANLRKAFAKLSKTDINLSKAQLSKVIQSGEFLGKLLKSVIQPLTKSVLIPLGLATASSAADAGINKQILGSGHNTTLIFSNDEIKDFIKIFKSLKDSGVLIGGISEIIKHEVKEQRGGFFSMLLGTLGASLLGNMLAIKRVIRAGEGTARVSFGSKGSALKNF